MASGLVCEEYAELAELAGSLGHADWAEPSLCQGWTVRDVVGHVLAWERVIVLSSLASWPRQLVVYGGLRARTRLSVDRLNQRLRREPALEIPDLVQGLRAASSAPRRLFDMLAPGAQLAEVMVHQQDVRRALGPGHLRAIPLDRVVAALNGVRRLPGVDVRGRLRSVRLIADDVDWSAGRGPLVEGPGEAILLALAGRRAALGDLRGTGVPALAATL